MELALALSKTGLGRVWPNPSVGCLLVRDGQVVAQACTGPGGRPHAEQLAVLQAGELAAGATAYVSLEPCSHWGVTPPCVLVLQQARVARVVIATRDPDPRVDGSGVERLRHYGIDVTFGVLEEQARELNAGFMTRLGKGRPLVSAAPASAAGALYGWAVATGQDAILVSLEGHRAEKNHGHAVPRVWVDLCGQLDGSPPEAPEPASAQSMFPRWLIHVDGRPLGEIGPVDEVFDVSAVTVAGVQRLDVKAALAALGSRGLTRIAVAAADPLTSRLREARLVDRDQEP